jgi:hypothetical protein
MPDSDELNLQNPGDVADWIRDNLASFPLTIEEKDILDRVARRIYWGDKTAVKDLHGLRILYWQIVGWNRR